MKNCTNWSHCCMYTFEGWTRPEGGYAHLHQSSSPLIWNKFKCVTKLVQNDFFAHKNHIVLVKVARNARTYDASKLKESFFFKKLFPLGWFTNRYFFQTKSHNLQYPKVLVWIFHISVLKRLINWNSEPLNKSISNSLPSTDVTSRKNNKINRTMHHSMTSLTPNFSIDDKI